MHFRCLLCHQDKVTVLLPSCAGGWGGEFMPMSRVTNKPSYRIVRARWEVHVHRKTHREWTFYTQKMADIRCTYEQRWLGVYIIGA
jgi:hypothetical protein